MGEILVFRMGEPELNMPNLSSQEIFDCHFEHLQKHGKLLFTTRSPISLDRDIETIIFVNRAMTCYFEADVVAKGTLSDGKGLTVSEDYRVPEDYQVQLKEEEKRSYRWFALENLQAESLPFKQGLFQVTSTGKDVFDSLKNSQGAFTYVSDCRE